MKNISMKKLLSLLLVLAMLVSLFPAALAEGEDAPSDGIITADDILEIDDEEPAGIPELEGMPEGMEPEEELSEGAPADEVLTGPPTELPAEETAKPAEEPEELPEEPAEVPEEEPEEEPTETGSEEAAEEKDPEAGEAAEEEAEEEEHASEDSKEALPYGFKGLPEDYELSEAQLEEKRVLTDEGILAAVQSGVGEYAAGEVLFSAESVEYARMVAEAYNAELAEFSGYMGKLRLTENTVAEAVECAADMELPLPAVSPNWKVALDPDMPTVGAVFDNQAQAAAYSGLMWQDWIDNTAWPDELMSDPGGAYQYQHDIVHSYGAWGVTTGSPDVIVAVVDSGVDYTHPDLSGNVLPGYDFADGDSDPMDEQGHGTRVAGIIAASMGNGIGGAGIAPGVSILPVRVLDKNGNGSEYSIASGIDYAWQNGAKIINLSLGGNYYNPLELAAIRRAVSSGATVIVAMGNNGTNIKCFPAAFDEVIAVAATDISGGRAPYSNYGAWCDVSAPGSAIWSTTGGGYECRNGTSMAAPVVSGVAALFMSKYGTHYNASQMRACLMGACNRISGKDMGAGIIDAAKLFGVTKGGHYTRVFNANGTEITDGRVPSDGYLTLRSAGATAATTRFLYSADGKNPAVQNGAVVHGAEVAAVGRFDSEQGCFVLPLTEFEVGQIVDLRIMELNEAGMAGEVTRVELLITEPEDNKDAEEQTEEEKDGKAKIASIVMNGEVPSLAVGATRVLPVEIRNTDGEALSLKDVSVTWISSDPTVAEVKTVQNEKTGEYEVLVYARKVGTARLSGTVEDESVEPISVSVSVSNLVSSITITGQSIVAPGTSATYKASLVLPKNTKNKKVTWAVDPVSVWVTCNPTSGKVTVDRTAPLGATFSVLANSTDGGNVWSNRIDVTVDNKAGAVGLKLNNAAELKNSATITLQSANLPGTSANDRSAWLDAWRVAGKTGSIYDRWAGIQWTTSNAAIVSIDEDNGQGGIRVNAHNAGTATLTAKAMDGSNKTANVKIRVTVPASSITVISKSQDKDFFYGLDNGLHYIPIAYGKSQGNTAVLGATYGTPSVRKVAWGVDLGGFNEYGEYYTDWSLTHNAASKRYVSINASGNLTLKANAELALGYDYAIRVYASTTDGTGLRDEVYYRPIPQINKVMIEDGYGHEVKKTELRTSWGEGRQRFEILGYGKSGRTYFRSLPNFSVSSSDPNVASGIVFIGYDDSYGYYGMLDVVRNSSGKAGSATITVKTTDGSNKSAKISVKVINDSAPTAVSITRHPANVTVAEGTAASFSITASGTSVYYEWQMKRRGESVWVSAGFEGHDTSTLRVPGDTRYNSWQFRCLVRGADSNSAISNAATLTVNAKQVRTIVPGTTTAVISTGGESVRFRFVPTLSGSYTLTSTGSDDTCGYLYDASDNQLDYDDDGGESNNFSITYDFAAGTTYFFEVRYYSSDTTGTICLVLSANFHDADITTHPANLTVAPNATATFRVTATGHSLSYQWEMKAPGSETWQNSSLNGNKTSTLSFTATSAYNNYEFRCRVTGNDGVPVYSDTARLRVIASISPGTTTAVISAGGERVRFRFVPTLSGSYTLTSTGSDDTYGYLYDASENQLAYDDDGGESNNFSITYDFAAGTTYFFEVRYYSSDTTGTIRLVLSANFHDADITTHPANLTVDPNATATFRVTATGHSLSYQWEMKAPGSETWQNSSLNGNKTSTLSFTATSAYNNYEFRCRVTGNDGVAVYSNSATLYVRSASTKYRALLFGEVNFSDGDVCNRNWGDVLLMTGMLRSVKGPDGNPYDGNIYGGKDYSPSQIRNAIAATFADATEQDVSLFFIATHGDVSNGAGSAYAGALATANGEFIYFRDLASWLKAVPGKVIVIVESCGSGAAVYANSANNGAETEGMADDQFTQALIDAFASADEETKEVVAQTGELRVANKFYVLTASALQQLSFGREGSSASDSYNNFTKWLTNGVGTSGNFPADMQYGGNKDGIVTLEELYRYISAVGDNTPISYYDKYGNIQTGYQTVKRYPEYSSYQLFTR
ncbi:MAG: S8 family serine peptidase [Oscillospiraceae bacterium]|nr:S8 family serine peptidase [Oscillospiraceae bacterium]